MKKQLGDLFPDFLQSLDTPAPVSIRINNSKIQARPELEAVPWMESAFYLPERPIFTLDPLLHAGAYYVQEASSMFLGHVFKKVVPQVDKLKVLDLCGAPGGKSTLLASLMPEDGMLICNEVIRSRANILVENIQKWGNPLCWVSNNDPKDFSSLAGFFDVLLIDAPCSGEGLFRRDPKAASEWSPANVQLCVERQRRILLDSWDSLKPGGVLIYSTCTYNLEENEENIAWLTTEVEAESLEIPIMESWNVKKEQLGEIWGYRFFPNRTKGEGLFITAVRKGENGKEFKVKKNRKSIFEKIDKETQKELGSYLREKEKFQLFKRGDEVFALHLSQKDMAHALEDNLKILHRGIPIGEVKKKNFVPAHGLALSPLINQDNFERVNLDHGESLKFLSRAPISKELKKGWKLFCYQNHPLGWGKPVNQRINNYYPQHWRIRMNIPEEERWFSLSSLINE
ncbi:MAG: RsmB/NOP family class I SAM-dependent RNA methyltransferase [Bacteroidia bacterium]|nr:RsmB/NOP family class I SAM-dependent RNA methyltransferase [Bacteroidia bacterium]